MRIFGPSPDLMICRHAPGDPNCSKNGGGYQPAPATPDASNYTIEEVERVGRHLVMRVKFPNCWSCAYEGNKVMVFLNVTEKQALQWRKIDPHFRDPKIRPVAAEAPSPAARFPGSVEGWQDALAYAKSKT